MDTDLALLILRVIVGLLAAAHGAQKLFPSFGAGIAGTAAFLASLGLRPARVWAMLAGLAELGGGVLLMLGFLYPLAPVGILAAMAMATATVHWNKPIWASSGGAELPLIYAAAAITLLLTGPGDYALDETFGLDLDWLTVPALVGAALGIAVALLTRNRSSAAVAGSGQPAGETSRSA